MCEKRVFFVKRDGEESVSFEVSFALISEGVVNVLGFVIKIKPKCISLPL